MTWDLATVKDVSLVIGGAAALVTLAVGLVEYGKRNEERKAVTFVEMRRRFLENPEFQAILLLLDTDDPALAQIPLQRRRNFLGFLEELALLVRSKAIRPEVAHYMFGRYVRLAERSVNLWSGMDRDDPFWALFRLYAAEGERFEIVPESRLRL